VGLLCRFFIHFETSPDSFTGKMRFCIYTQHRWRFSFAGMKHGTPAGRREQGSGVPLSAAIDFMMEPIQPRFEPPRMLLPRWKCHKEVEAFKIARVWMDENTGIWYLFSGESGIGPVIVSNEYIQRHKPELGGYYVRYPDGYESFSPTKAFEEGYTLLTDRQKEHKPEDYF
jgi:hypothetical protein